MSRNPIRRFVFWVTLTGFTAACVLWILHIPRRPDHVWRAVPAEATWITVHRNLADHWLTWSAHPLVRAMAENMGFHPEALDTAARIPAVQDWMDRLVPETVVVFRFPSYRNSTGSSVWGAVSWIGGQSQRLRWMLKGKDIPGIRRVGENQGRMIWALDFPSAPAGQTLYFAFEEGLLVACLSNHPADLIRLLSAYDGIAQSFDPGGYGEDLLSAAPLSGVFLGTGPLGPVTFALDGLEPARLSGRIQLLEGPPPLRAEILKPPQFLAGRAEATLAIPSDLVTHWVLPFWRPHWVESLWPGLDPLFQRPMVLGLFGGDLSGRLFGLRVPALVAATPVADADQTFSGMLALIDTMNARYRLGLIAAKPAADGPQIYTLEGTSDNVYSKLAPEERAGFAVTNGWFIASSHAGALRAILSVPMDPPPPAPDPAEILRGRMNLGAAGKSIRSVLAVLSLQAAMRGEGTAGFRDRLRAWRDWVLVFESLNKLDFRVTQDGRIMRVEFSAALLPPHDSQGGSP